MRQRLEAEYREESASLLPERRILQAVYVRVLTEKTEIDVDDVEIAGDAATATVTVKTVAKPIRDSLREIIGRLDPAKQDAFNMPDALRMVAGQMALDEPVVSQTKKVKLRKGDDWTLVETER